MFLFFYNYLLFILVVTILFLLGIFIRALLRIQFNKIGLDHIFFSLLLGVIILNIVYASIRTHFITGQLLFLLPFLYLIIEQRKLKNKPLIKNHNDFDSAVCSIFPLKWQVLKTVKLLLIFFLSSLSIFYINYENNVINSIFPYILPNEDYIFYNKLSYFIDKTGQENIFHVLNFLDERYHGVKPYHYFDLWFNAGISHFFKGLYAVNFQLITYPLFCSLVFLGLSALVTDTVDKYDFPNSSIGKIKRYKIVLVFFTGLLLMFFGGVFLPFYSNSKYLINVASFAHSPFYGPSKLIYIYLFIIAFFILIKNNNKMLSFIPLLCLPIASITTLPGIIGGIFLFLIINLKLKLITKNQSLRLFLYTIMLVIGILCFYSFFDKKLIKVESVDLRVILDLFDFKKQGIKNLKTIFNIFTLSLLQILIAYLPLVIIFVTRFKDIKIIFKLERLKFSTIISGCILFSALLGWIIIFNSLNSCQIFYNIGISVINIFLIMLICEVVAYYFQAANKKNLNIRSFKITANSILWGCILLSSFNFISKTYKTLEIRNSKKYSNEYLIDIKNYIGSSSMPLIGGSFYGKDSYQSVFSKYTTTYTLGGYLLYMHNGFTTVSLSDFEGMNFSTNPLTREREILAIKMGIFYNYIQDRKKNNTFTSIEEGQKSFIKMHNIKYLIFSKDALIPSFVQSNIKSKVTDKLSGEIFIVLK